MRAIHPSLEDAERTSEPGVADAATVPPPGRAGEPSAEELDLVAALGRGEPWAAQEVWERHASRVRRLMIRALGPLTEVDDLTQEVFMRIFSRIGILRDAGALREFVI